MGYIFSLTIKKNYLPDSDRASMYVPGVQSTPLVKWATALYQRKRSNTILLHYSFFDGYCGGLATALTT